LVDLFTVLLTWWLEAVPFGDLPGGDLPTARAALFAFNNYQVNRNNQLEFAFARTDVERYEGVNDGPRKYWAVRALSLGLLRRVDKDHAEFTPRLYSILDGGKGDDNGGTNAAVR